MPMNNATTPLIHLTDISKVFYADEVETHALAGVHFDIGKGEYVSISGPSGCGKSTLLAILGLLDTASAGAYTINGTPVQAIGASERARIRNREKGFIFQRSEGRREGKEGVGKGRARGSRNHKKKKQIHRDK